MIPSIVYEISVAFDHPSSMTARRIYNSLSNKLHFPVLRDTILPRLVEAGVLSCSISGEGTGHESRLYKWLGFSNADFEYLGGKIVSE